MKSFIYFVTALFYFPLIAQESETLTKAQAKADLDYVAIAVKDVHPNPFNVVSEAKFNRSVAKAKRGIKESVSTLDFYAIATPLLATLGDNNTRLKFSLENWKEANPLCFPFNPIVKGNKLYAPQQDFIPAGVEITGITCKSTEEILLQLKNLNNIDREVHSSVMENSFIEQYGLTYGFTEYHVVKFIHNGKVKTISLNAIRFVDLLKELEEAQIEKIPFKFELIDAKTALLRIDGFVQPESYSAFLNNSFSTIREMEIENVLIDIRNNTTGGSELVDELLQYIANKPYQLYGTIQTKHGQGISADDAAILSKHKPGELHVEEMKPLKEIGFNPNRFNGNVYVLTSGQTRSVAADFVWCFQYFEMGTVIGEETGGKVVSFGDIVNNTLPNSKLDLHISHKVYYGYGATENEQNGVIPDYVIDAKEAVDFTLEVIRKGSLSL